MAEMVTGTDANVQEIFNVLLVKDAMETMRNIGLITKDDYEKYFSQLNDKSHKAIEAFING